jgi:hypothetical protein
MTPSEPQEPVRYLSGWARRAVGPRAGALLEAPDGFSQKQKVASIERDRRGQHTTWNTLRGFFDVRQAMEFVLTVAWYNCVVHILLPWAKLSEVLVCESRKRSAGARVI